MSASEPNSSLPSPMVIETPQVPETPGRGAAAERRKWPQHSSEPAGLSVDCPPAISTPLSGERRSSVGELLDVESRQSCNRNRSPQGAPHGMRQAGAPPGMGLTIECSPRLSSPRIQSLSLEIGASPASVRGVTLEDSWKGEILPGFLFLGDRVTASDMDRLTTLEVRHILEGPPPGLPG